MTFFKCSNYRHWFQELRHFQEFQHFWCIMKFSSNFCVFNFWNSQMFHYINRSRFEWSEWITLFEHRDRIKSKTELYFGFFLYKILDFRQPRNFSLRCFWRKNVVKHVYEILIRDLTANWPPNDRLCLLEVTLAKFLHVFF